jgi:ABC-2 type transport system ATP-binding protein
MSDISLLIEDVNLSFPRNRIGLKSVLGWLTGFKFKSQNIEPFHALKNINLTISKGEVIGIIGRNGASKSTLLRVMSGIFQPDSGMALSSGSVSLLSNVRIGFNGNLSGRENVYLYGSILGHSRRSMSEMMQGIIDFSELSDFIDQPLRTYSSGMQARLGLSIASAVKPEILLIDEVLAVGDISFKERSRHRIKEMVDGASTVVIVSHSLNYIKEVCNRVIVMNQGEIEFQGPPEESIQFYLDLNSRGK